MPCSTQAPTCKEQLRRFIDGEMTDEEMVDFYRHMDECDDCFQAYESHRASGLIPNALVAA